MWASIPAVLRVMAGWLLLGIGLLDLAVELDGGLTVTYLVFHIGLCVGGILLLVRRRPMPSFAALILVPIPGLTGLLYGYPFPLIDWFHTAADLIFWSCAGLLLTVALALAERLLPERRTPVDLSHYPGHAEPRATENVGGLP
ncbi:hypothetical protein [Actinoplanes derwentensis]|uniref:Uncharacterized protein n=1 Tax=Actinoplanes derwentensis TaxID=113562 RepID=A0A1H2D1A5_9ACTN|nr:hypothetical protein [Actinoplanes derwentensis]GID86775.1 hypothetical protein Ade03nite_56990 [Actinoplanes derwentensis]SDT76555.1 hypothetical protein SAMN04489716_7658 [Actinoplanes derwentensis]